MNEKNFSTCSRREASSPILKVEYLYIALFNTKRYGNSAGTEERRHYTTNSTQKSLHSRPLIRMRGAQVLMHKLSVHIHQSMMHVSVHTTLTRVRSTCACHTDTAAARKISVNILATIFEECGYFVFDRQTTLQPEKAV